MIDAKRLDELARTLAQMMPEAVQVMQQDLEKNLRATLQSAFQKMDLVTREEYDVQVGVLERTREKLTELEARVKALEESLVAPIKPSPAD
jgi:BMFP domain-containing protein YqiC